MSDQHEARSAAACQVLLIEEDEAYRAVVEACVRLAGCRVDWAPSPGLALPMLERQRFDLVIWGVSTLHGDRRGEVIPEFRLGTEAMKNPVIAHYHSLVLYKRGKLDKALEVIVQTRPRPIFEDLRIFLLMDQPDGRVRACP